MRVSEFVRMLNELQAVSGDAEVVLFAGDIQGGSAILEGATAELQHATKIGSKYVILPDGNTTTVVRVW